MKFLSLVVLSIVSTAAHADPGCSSLAKFTGNYQQVSATCGNVMGADTNKFKFLRVSPYQTTDNGAALNGFWIAVIANINVLSGGTGDGPSTSPNDRFRCVQSGETVSVSSPFAWNYSFSGNMLTINGPDCLATYSKIN